jgi:pyruvate dehydrogenase E1 component alpha subunit
MNKLALNSDKFSNLIGKLFISNGSRAFSTSQPFNSDLAYTLEKGFDLHKLESGPNLNVECTKSEALDYYHKMQSIRRLETTAGNLYKEKQIRGFCHLYSGQEAVCVGMKAAFHENDSVITAYRAHGWTYVMGVSLLGVLAELTGRKTGCAKGKGGSMHMYTKNFYGGNGIVGAQVPLGAGIALKHKYMGEQNICVALYGDGAANQGQVFEAYNMAKLWNLPCIFVCENNGYAMGTSVNRGSASTEFYTRGDYIPGIRVDGMDVLGVKEATRFSREYALKNGPIVLEMVTYRYSGHSMSDPGTSYRKREEIQEVRQKRDPITTFSKKLIDHQVATPEELKAIDDKVRTEMSEVERRALTDPELDVQEVYNNIFINPEPDFKIRGCDNFSYHIGK